MMCAAFDFARSVHRFRHHIKSVVGSTGGFFLCPLSPHLCFFPYPTPLSPCTFPLPPLLPLTYFLAPLPHFTPTLLSLFATFLPHILSPNPLTIRLPLPFPPPHLPYTSYLRSSLFSTLLPNTSSPPPIYHPTFFPLPHLYFPFFRIQLLLRFFRSGAGTWWRRAADRRLFLRSAVAPMSGSGDETGILDWYTIPGGSIGRCSRGCGQAALVGADENQRRKCMRSGKLASHVRGA